MCGHEGLDLCAARDLKGTVPHAQHGLRLVLDVSAASVRQRRAPVARKSGRDSLPLVVGTGRTRHQIASDWVMWLDRTRRKILSWWFSDLDLTH